MRWDKLDNNNQLLTKWDKLDDNSQRISFHWIDETTYSQIGKGSQNLILAAYNELASNSSNRASALLSNQKKIYAGHASTNMHCHFDPAEEQAIRRGLESENLELRIKQLAIVAVQNYILGFTYDFHCPDMPDYVVRNKLFLQNEGKDFDVFLVSLKTNSNNKVEELHEAMPVYKTTLLDWYPM